MSAAAALSPVPVREVVHRSRGYTHGYITRLMSPEDLGEILKPFVFLDLFDNQGNRFPTFDRHPHFGFATLTYVAEGSVSYEDTNGATGILRAGGVEWMRAGKGVWHSGGAGEPGLTRGFQLWIALQPHLSSAPPRASTRAPAIFLEPGQRACCWEAMRASRARSLHPRPPTIWQCPSGPASPGDTNRLKGTQFYGSPWAKAV
jgi:hypothetical protein